ncbi:MAG TPA: SRPBCC family protein [Cyclobacteriaceae bacterium]|nr:SRPBCC family protein [Cyclobacteriaceae bacterium]
MYTAKQSITIAASRDKVWDALTKPELVKQYFFGTNVESTWKKGAPIRFTGEWEGKAYEDKGNILEITPGKLLKYNYWSSFSNKADVPENYANVTYRLVEMGGNTEFIVEQDGLDTEEAARHTESNWASIMQSLRQLLEKGKKGAEVV